MPEFKNYRTNTKFTNQFELCRVSEICPNSYNQIKYAHISGSMSVDIFRDFININTCTNLGLSANQCQTRVNKSFKHVRQNSLVFLVKGQWECVKPGLEQRPPAKTLRLHVYHATPRHLHRSQQTDASSDITFVTKLTIRMTTRLSTVQSYLSVQKQAELLVYYCPSLLYALLVNLWVFLSSHPGNALKHILS